MIVLVCSLVLVCGQAGAELSVTIDKMHVTMINKGSETLFTVTLPFEGAKEKQKDKWIGIGFNKSPEMVVKLHIFALEIIIKLIVLEEWS